MDQEYKGYTILVNAEHDDITKDWNGRYRIMNSEGIVAYESFSDPQKSEDIAKTAAEKAARSWVDQQ